MKRVMLLLPAVLMFCVTAQAQDVPRVEIAGGYSFLDANVNGSSFHLNGGFGSATENLIFSWEQSTPARDFWGFPRRLPSLRWLEAAERITTLTRELPSGYKQII